MHTTKKKSFLVVPNPFNKSTKENYKLKETIAL